MTIQLMACPICKTNTNHIRVTNGWECRVCQFVIEIRKVDKK